MHLKKKYKYNVGMNIHCIYQEETRRNTTLEQINIVYDFMTINDWKIPLLEAYLSTSYHHTPRSVYLRSLPRQRLGGSRLSNCQVWGVGVSGWMRIKNSSGLHRIKRVNFKGVPMYSALNQSNDRGHLTYFLNFW